MIIILQLWVVVNYAQLMLIVITKGVIMKAKFARLNQTSVKS